MGIVEKNYKTFKGFPKVHIAVFILTFFWPHFNYAQNELPTVAVLDFEGKGISKQIASSLTDRLATELGNTDAVILVERKQLERILEEQGLQQSGCTSQECVAEVGQLLGVQFMVSGSINKLGETFTIDAKMFSVETGENTMTVSKTHKGKIDELIPLMENIAWEIVGLESRPMETVAVLDFEGRGISQLEAATLTDRFTSSLGKTEAVLLVARQEMNEILEEQGFQQKDGCTSAECAAEVGGLLGVKNIVKGSIGKVGETYTIDAQIISVNTGATIKTVNKTYSGKIDGLITEIEIMAFDLVEMDPPDYLVKRQQKGLEPLTGTPKVKTKTGALLRSAFFPGWGQFYSGYKRWGYGYLGVEALLMGLVLKSLNDYSIAESDYYDNLALYRESSDIEFIYTYRNKSEAAHSEMEAADKMSTVLLKITGAVWLGNMIHAYFIGPDESEEAATPAELNFVMNPFSNEIRMRLEVGLD